MRFYRGVVRSYDSTNHKADVLLVGSMSGVVLGVPVAHHIGGELMVAGAACGVLFFDEGADGVVMCTFEGAPEAWVTPALIDFSPATPAWFMETAQTDQTLTLTPATYYNLSQAITVPTGRTYNVLALGIGEFECTVFAGWNLDYVRVYAGENAVGLANCERHNAVNERGTVTVAAATAITSTTTFSARVHKALDQNTEVIHRGSLVLLYWEATV